MVQKNKLILLNTPIGNISDTTPRVLQAIKELNIIVAEDTRSFRKLCDLIGVSLSSKTLLSFHDASLNENAIIDHLKEQSIGYASEAGSPVVSDPAYKLALKAIESGFEVESISGISSVINALEVSCLPTTPFSFYGFFPREKNKQKHLFSKWSSDGGTFIFFEGVSRVEKLCHLIHTSLPEAKVTIARELTKKFEQIVRTSGEHIIDDLPSLVLKGEFVFVIYISKKSRRKRSSDLLDLAKNVLDKKGKKKELSKLLAQILEQKASDIYELISK